MSTIQTDTELLHDTAMCVQCKIASLREARDAAFRLVYHSYLRADLTEPNRHETRVTPYHLLPTTEVFVGMCRGEIISTLSLIQDGELGLPIESVYAPEIGVIYGPRG